VITYSVGLENPHSIIITRVIIFKIILDIIMNNRFKKI